MYKKGRGRVGVVPPGSTIPTTEFLGSGIVYLSFCLLIEMSCHEHKDEVSMAEKVGAMEIEKVAALDARNVGDVSEEVDEDQLKLEKKTT